MCATSMKKNTHCMELNRNTPGQNEKKKVTPDTKDVDGDIRYRKDRADRGTNAHTQACAWLRTKGVELSRLTGTARLSSV